MTDYTRNRIEDGERALSFLERAGYRCCDMPACNCNSWHGGNAYNRLIEIEDALIDAGESTNGKTIIKAVEHLLSDRDELKSSNAELVEALGLAHAMLEGANMNASVVEQKVKASLKKHGEKQ